MCGGTVESACHSRMKEQKLSVMGCYRRKQWRCRKWEALLDMERYNCNVEEMDQGAVTLVVNLVRALEKVQLKVKKAKLMISLTEGGKEGKSKLIASHKYLEF